MEQEMVNGKRGRGRPAGRRGKPRAPEGWMERKETAQMVGCNVSTLWRWEAEGRMPKGKMYGNMKLWKRAVIERFLETLEVEQEDAA